MGEIACEAAREAWTELTATTGGREAEELVIHRAILAERQRCADVARAYLEDLAGCDLRDDEPEHIARAILNP
jgi:hypothetical protein